MRNADDYLARIKAIIVTNPYIVQWTTLREESQGDMGLFRYRLTLRDGSSLEMFERFQIVGEKPQVAKYSFHWQDATGQLRKRWDNAAHHPEVLTYPHHIHDGSEANARSHRPLDAEGVLAFITAELGNGEGTFQR